MTLVVLVMSRTQYLDSAIAAACKESYNLGMARGAMALGQYVTMMCPKVMEILDFYDEAVAAGTRMEEGCIKIGRAHV